MMKLKEIGSRESRGEQREPGSIMSALDKDDDTVNDRDDTVKTIVEDSNPVAEDSTDALTERDNGDSVSSDSVSTGVNEGGESKDSGCSSILHRLFHHRRNGKGDHHGKTNPEVATRPGTWGDVLRRFTHSWRIVVAIIIIVISAAGPVLWIRVVQPWMQDRSADDYESESVVVYDHKWDQTKRSSSKVDSVSVNPTQYILRYTDSRLTTSNSIGRDKGTYCFVFRGSRRSPAHHVKITVTLSDQKSRNLLYEQMDTLAYGMKKGTISTEVCLLLSSNEWTAIATEALAEIDYNDSAFTWTALRYFSEVDSSSLKNTSARAKEALSLVSDLKDKGFTEKSQSEITSDSLKTGSVLQWSRMMSNDNTVDATPAMWIDGSNVSDTSKYSMYDPDFLYSRIESMED